MNKAETKKTLENQNIERAMCFFAASSNVTACLPLVVIVNSVTNTAHGVIAFIRSHNIRPVWPFFAQR